MLKFENAVAMLALSLVAGCWHAKLARASAPPGALVVQASTTPQAEGALPAPNVYTRAKSGEYAGTLTCSDQNFPGKEGFEEESCAWRHKQVANTAPVERIAQERETGMYTLTTLLGELKFFGADGKAGAVARTITLNDKPLISTKNEKDAQDSSLSLMREDLKASSTDYGPKSAERSGPPKIRRMVILLGPVANCAKQFVVLDFTGKEAFVSERFGYNPGDKSCLAFKRAKWGKKESEITLEGPMTYVYYTRGKVIGPI